MFYNLIKSTFTGKVIRSAKIINIISILLLQFISFLFILKYSVRISHSFFLSIVLAVIYCAIITTLLLKIDFINLIKSSIFEQKMLFILYLFITLLFVIIVNVVPESSQVGRLPAIKSWLSNLLAGKYPYNSRSNPSGFPFPFFIALPFYPINNLDI